MQGAASGRTVSITHSDHYKTSFRYDPQSRPYKMQMYSRISGKFENTVDELNAKQLSFDNLLVCFAPVSYTHLDVYKRQVTKHLHKPCLYQVVQFVKLLLAKRNQFCKLI